MSDTVASGNGTVGIAFGDGGLATGNTVYGNHGTGLSMNSQVGYTHNVLFNNGTDVHGGVNLGNNLCGTIVCQ